MNPLIPLWIGVVLLAIAFFMAASNRRITGWMLWLGVAAMVGGSISIAAAVYIGLAQASVYLF